MKPYLFLQLVVPWIGTIVGAAIALTILFKQRQRLRSWWKEREKVESVLRLAGVTLLASYICLAAGFIVDNPGADHNSTIANEQRRTIVQVAGGFLGAGALLFYGLRAIQTERQIRQADDQRESQEELKRNELSQLRWHNALDLLGKGTKTEPQLQSRVAAVLMLSSLDLPGEQNQIVLETICHYVRIHAVEEDEPRLRQDIECCLSAIQRITKRGQIESAQSVSLRAAFLPGADFQEADLRKWRLQGAILSNADFRGANLSDAVFDSADLSGAKFDEKTVLVGASFQNCTMNATQAAKARFICADFKGAITGKGADFSDCNFDDADLSEVSFEHAKTDGWDITKAKNYKPSVRPAEEVQDDHTPPLESENI